MPCPSAVFDEGQPNSLCSPIVTALVRVAGRVRDRLSADTCEHRRPASTATCARSPTPAGLESGELLAVLNNLLLELAAFAGLLQENTTRTQGWRFLDLGRRLERCTADGRGV